MEALLVVIENNSEYIKYYENAQTIVVINYIIKTKVIITIYGNTNLGMRRFGKSFMFRL
jgi:hypothetical protein